MYNDFVAKRATFGNRPSLWETHPELAKELVDPEQGFTVTPGSSKRLPWECQRCSHRWVATPNSRTYSKSGCPPCAKRISVENHRATIIKSKGSLCDNHPELAAELVDPDEGKSLTSGSGNEVWWACRTCGHRWRCSPSDRVQGARCQNCARPPLSASHPDLAAELMDPADAERITSGSKEKVWWKCAKCGHQWCATTNSRMQGCGCPGPCRGKKIGDALRANAIKRRGPLAETHPHLAAELQDPEDGLRYTAGSNRKLAWVCATCGHKWRVSAGSRVNNNSKCPSCARVDSINGRRAAILKRGGSLLETHPHLAAELVNPKDGEEVTAGSDRKVQWWCKDCGRPWWTTPGHRTRASGATGCPRCAAYGYSKGIPGSLYVLLGAVGGRPVVQFGISNHLEKRLKQHRRTGFVEDPVLVIYCADGGEAYSLELLIKRRRSAIDLPSCIQQGARFCGASESFFLDIPGAEEFYGWILSTLSGLDGIEGGKLEQ